MHKAFDKLKSKLGDKDHGGAPHSGGAPAGQPGRRAVYPQPGGPPGPGHMPPKVKNLNYTDAHEFLHPSGRKHDTLRDLGFSGVLDGNVIWTWGDTLMGTPQQNMICAVDSASIGHVDRPMASTDTALHGDNVRNFIDCNHDEEKNGGLSCFAFGGTNVVEVAPGKGVVYFLKNHRPGGKDQIQGAGVAEVTLQNHGGHPVPVAKRCHEKLWERNEPQWGDVGVCVNNADGHIYAYGHGPQQNDELAKRTFLCRCPKDKYSDLGAYEYWNNEAHEWTRQRMADGNGENGTIKLKNEHAIFNWLEMNQAAPFWSNYFNRWMLLFGNSFGFSDVMCKTADKLEGPWDNHGEIAKTKPDGHKSGDGFRYCQTGHPEFDESGKTVLVTWTVDNVIWGVTVEWE